MNAFLNTCLQKIQVLYPFGSSVVWKNRQGQRAEAMKGERRRWVLVTEGGGRVSGVDANGDI